MHTTGVICVTGGGVLSLFMVLFHMQFSRLFGWKRDFEKLSDTNRRIVTSVHVALTLMFALFAYLSLFHTAELASAGGVSLGVLAGYSLFWLWRTVWQAVYFKPAGKSRFVVLHYLLIAVFFLLCTAYAVPILIRYGAPV